MSHRKKTSRPPVDPEGQATASAMFAGLPEIDLNATKPIIVAMVKVGDRTFAVHSTLDVQMGVLQGLLAEEERIRKDGGWMDQVALARRQIRLVVPALTEADLDGLTARQIIRLSTEVIGILQPKEPKE